MNGKSRLNINQRQCIRHRIKQIDCVEMCVVKVSGERGWRWVLLFIVVRELFDCTTHIHLSSSCSIPCASQFKFFDGKGTNPFRMDGAVVVVGSWLHQTLWILCTYLAHWRAREGGIGRRFDVVNTKLSVSVIDRSEKRAPAIWYWLTNWLNSFKSSSNSQSIVCRGP